MKHQLWTCDIREVVAHAKEVGWDDVLFALRGPSEELPEEWEGRR